MSTATVAASTRCMRLTTMLRYRSGCGAVKVKSARPGCPGACTPTTIGDPLACTPLATTAYSAGTVIRSTAVA